MTTHKKVIWKKHKDLAALNAMSEHSLMAHLNIVFTQMSDSELWASMPVDVHTRQPFGVLHGGASVALAESVASMAAWLSLEEGYYPVGLDINANHIKAVRQGHVSACARPIHLGKQSQVWGIELFNDDKGLVCSARMTVLIHAQ